MRLFCNKTKCANKFIFTRNFFLLNFLHWRKKWQHTVLDIKAFQFFGMKKVTGTTLLKYSNKLSLTEAVCDLRESGSI